MAQATLVVRHDVEDYAAWRSVYDSVESLRSEYGCTDAEVMVSPSDPNDVFVLHRFPTIEQAEGYAGSQGLRDAMGRAASRVRRGSSSPSEPELSTPQPQSRGGARRGAASAPPSERAAFELEFPGASWLAVRATRQLEEVGAMVEAMVASVAQRHDLSHAALNALAVIEGSGGPMAVGAVSAHMHITSGTMTGVLDTLERNGYIERFSDPDDRRRVLVDVTPDARRVLDRLLPEVVQTATVVLSDLSDTELNRLLGLLARVRRSVEDRPDSLDPPPARRAPRHVRRS